MQLERTNYRLAMGIVMITTLSLLTSLCAHASVETNGLWLMPQKNACNTGRADVPAHMKTAPKEIWACGYDPEDYTYVRPVTINGNIRYLCQLAHGLQLIKPNGKTVWRQANVGLSAVTDIYNDPGTGKPMALVQCGSAVIGIADISDGRVIWKWQVAENALSGGVLLLQRKDRVRIVTFPQNDGYGWCYEITRGSRIPQLLWKTDIHDRCWNNFGPNIAAADMNKDGIDEIVISGKPAYFGVIDQDTGKILFDLHYDTQIIGAENDHKGRPYGVMQIADMDGDGYPDLVMVSKAVEEYIGVAKNVGGKALSLAWSKWVSLDFPEEPVKLRTSIQPLADLNGDGKRKLVLSLFNEDNDGRWKTVVFDGMLGYGKRLVELKDRYLIGCFDINGDGALEIITSLEKSPDPARNTLIAVDGRTFNDIASVNASPVGFNAKNPLNVGTWAPIDKWLIVTKANGISGLTVSQDQTEKLWRIVDGKSVTEPLNATVLARKVLASEGTGVLKSTADIPAGNKIGGIAAGDPLVSVFNGKRELIFTRSDGKIIGGFPNFSRNGEFKESWLVKGIMPAVWIGADGRRIVCAVDPDHSKVYLYEPKYQSGDNTPILTITPPHLVKGSYLVRSSCGLIPFGDKEFRILVGMQIGQHAVASAVYDLSGNVVWEDKNTGPYPRSAAVDDLYSTGKMNVMMDNHSMEFIFDETGNKKMFAYGWTYEVPGRDNGAKYVLPIIGPFGPSGEKRILLSSGLDSVETVDAYGNRVSKIDLVSCYVLDWSCSSVGKIRPNAWDFAMIDKFGRFSCVEIETCKLRWKLDFQLMPHLPSVITTADLDGDGRDNFLVSTSAGDLIAIDEKDGEGFVMWKKHFDAPIRGAFVADVDGDGVGEVIVELTNGFVRILK